MKQNIYTRDGQLLLYTLLYNTKTQTKQQNKHFKLSSLLPNTKEWYGMSKYYTYPLYQNRLNTE